MSNTAWTKLEINNPFDAWITNPIFLKIYWKLINKNQTLLLSCYVTIIIKYLNDSEPIEQNHFDIETSFFALK